jgi:hypothetical protein
LDNCEFAALSRILRNGGRAGNSSDVGTLENAAPYKDVQVAAAEADRRAAEASKAETERNRVSDLKERLYREHVAAQAK